MRDELAHRGLHTNFSVGTYVIITEVREHPTLLTKRQTGLSDKLNFAVNKILSPIRRHRSRLV